MAVEYQCQILLTHLKTRDFSAIAIAADHSANLTSAPCTKQNSASGAV